MINPVNTRSFDGTTANTTPSNPINDPSVSNHQGSNTFDLSAQNALTARYGEITPFFYSVGVPGDRFSLQSSHMLRTYTLSAPMLSTLRMHKQNFSVPLSVIMPNTWDLIYKNPVKGNDIPDDALCSFSFGKFQYALATLLSTKYDVLNSASAGVAKRIAAIQMLPALMLYYQTFSSGSLVHMLGISCNSERVSTIDSRFDAAFQTMMNSIHSLDSKTFVFSISVNSDYTIVVYPTASSVRNMFMMSLEHPDVFEGFTAGLLMNSTFGDALVSFCSTLSVSLTDLLEDDNSDDPFNYYRYVNLYKVIAYQMICAQYFTNDHVDNVYTAKIWLQNMQSVAFNGVGISLTNMFFTYNGIKVQYDVFSSHLLDLLCTTLMSGSSNGISMALYFFINLFTFRRSLKYGDYFNSARTQPLAVGDVTAPVVGNKVSAIDTTKSISYQRFLNAVNRAGSYIKDYVRSIFGVTPEQVEPIPNFLSRETFIIGKDEIDNTSDNQGNVVTNLVDQDSRFMFDIFVDTPSIILGLLTFDCVGCYRDVTEKDNFHLDRYDMFNPFLQNIGDQSVILGELKRVVPDGNFEGNYGYQVRNAEYKFKVNQCHGGFVYNLPAWLFTFDDDSISSISEDSIRSKPLDLDAFYSSLTYGSTAGYYHFIISTMNEVHATRKMQFEPNIL